jgi:hypothetical protein
MPWGRGTTNPKRPEGPRELCLSFGSIQPEALAALQAASRFGLLTQGIGLRPQPWARLCRPIGPDLPKAQSRLRRRMKRSSGFSRARLR